MSGVEMLAGGVEVPLPPANAARFECGLPLAKVAETMVYWCKVVGGLSSKPPPAGNAGAGHVTAFQRAPADEPASVGKPPNSAPGAGSSTGTVR